MGSRSAREERETVKEAANDDKLLTFRYISIGSNKAPVPFYVRRNSSRGNPVPFLFDRMHRCITQRSPRRDFFSRGAEVFFLIRFSSLRYRSPNLLPNTGHGSRTRDRRDPEYIGERRCSSSSPDRSRADIQLNDARGILNSIVRSRAHVLT